MGGTSERAIPDQALSVSGVNGRRGWEAGQTLEVPPPSSAPQEAKLPITSWR